jgi:hypothetical protein
MSTACSLLPGEFNLSPLYRHRLDADGSVREMDVLWPFFHYRKTEDGGWEFRLRPLYRYVSEGPEHEATEQQILPPLGRTRSRRGETLSRLFPLWRYSSRENEEGLRDIDWNFCMLVYGGWSEDHAENYFAFIPFYADIPDFLTYDRFQMHLFPLHVALTKGDTESHLLLWPLIGFGGNESGTEYWHRFLPFYAVSVDTEKFERYAFLWPFFGWGTENLNTDDPVSRFFFFPLFGRQTSERVDGWTFLWPFFQKVAIEDRGIKVDVLWPIYRYERRDTPGDELYQWWVWPLVGHTETEHQHAWTWLWPFIWLREYDDPNEQVSQQWFLPFYWRVHQQHDDGRTADFTKVWPLFHASANQDGTAEWSALSIWPWRGGNSSGFLEAYGWLWEIAAGRSGPGYDNFDLAAHVFTTSERAGRRQTSVPLLFNYESDEKGGTLRLLQFIPIPFGGGSEPSSPEQH